MNDKIKTAVNLGALILVPLINERHRLKENPDYVAIKKKTVNTAIATKDVAAKAKDRTVDTTQKVVQTTRNVKDKTVAASHFVASTAQNIQENRAENKKVKETKQMGKQLEKAISQRQKEEEKRLKERQQQMKEELAKADKEAKKKQQAELKGMKKKEADSASFLSAFTRLRPQTKVETPETVYDFNHDEDYSNAPLFETHRQQMAAHIERRGKY